MQGLLSRRDLNKLQRSNIVDYIMNEVRIIEKEIGVNELDEDLGLLWKTQKRKCQIHNLMALLNILVQECEHDPLSGKILFEAEWVLNVLKSMQKTLEGQKPDWLLSKQTPPEVNAHLHSIIAYLEEWRTRWIKRIAIPLGNPYTYDTYHPQFPLTYKYKPISIPNDYRSNFFFEVKVAELCPFLNLILYHPFNEVQCSLQKERTIAELMQISIDVDLTDIITLESADNIRALRIHGPKDNKDYPGSYIVLKAGHHRSRELFRRFLKGEIDGDKKIIVQRVELKESFPKRFLANVKKEIILRESLREKLHR